ncbi:M48 family metallopeptidase [Mariluticola halotolerans]|uniref:M48 family metallopeptidase n=1 Tax=Mariluticola halotolerans TaxID=2909283 RepID=UPI0026E1FBF3|nr:SprT family zinc-dependent metalloprotease [Mariluticola halotolerans]UJQ93451.1 M48 family metallopeptidase [Mariluticola halotolerans]
MLGFGKNKWPESTHAEIDGQQVTIAVKVRQNAKSYRLTIAAGGKPVLSVPPHGHWREAAGFLNRNQAWLEARLKRTPDGVSFRDGAVIPLRGVDHLIVAAERVRGTVEVIAEDERTVLLVPGGPAHMARRLTDWLKAEALRDIEECVGLHARQLGVRPTGISMRGQSTRWGSCSSAGRLNFNWRLILAPPFVLDYVAAHEVAHMVEMNHSQAFWDTVERTLPDMNRGRAWLKAHGRQLMAYGVDS